MYWMKRIDYISILIFRSANIYCQPLGWTLVLWRWIRQAWVLSLHGFQLKTGKEKSAITLPSLFLAAHCGKCCDSSGKVLTAHVQECAGRVWPALAAQVESQLPYWMIFSRGIKDHRGQADVGLNGGMEASSRQREPCYHQLWAIEIFSARMNWPGSHFRRTPLQCGGGGWIGGRPWS